MTAKYTTGKFTLFLSTDARAENIAERVRQLLSAIDMGGLEMNSPEIDSGDPDIQPHQWHEEWVDNAREALATYDRDMSESVEFEVKVTAVITEFIPEQEPSLLFSGEPASGGYPEIIRIAVRKETPGCMCHASWLLDIIPQATLDKWCILLYENALDGKIIEEPDQ